MYMQQVLQTLNNFWTDKGCMLWSPYHTEVGAGTSNPATFLRVLGPEPWWVAYPEPSIRPADGRYGENPNRLQHYYQYQVILKPSPPDVQELFLQSLEALGLDLSKNDFRFVEDNWQSPSLGAWGLGWEAWLNGMEILQFTYFQQCGGVDLGVRACELTYGIERIATYLQGVDSVYDLVWAPSGITYRDIYHASEVEWCKYNFDHSDADKLFQMFDMSEQEGQRLLDEGLVLPAYDQCLKLSHLFNLLDARGALSVTERGRFLLRCRAVAERCAKAFAAQREEMGYPLMRLPRPGKADEGKPAEVDQAAFNEKDTFLLEIGVEELPHNDVKAVLRQTSALVEKLLAGASLEHGPVTVDVTPRRIAITVEDMPACQADVTKEARGPKKASAQDGDGNWTIPAQRFAEAHGAKPEDMTFRKQGKAEYCFLEVHQKGQHIVELMSSIVDKLLRGMQFGKSMGWEDSTVTFSRPIRWLLALHGETVVPVTWKLREESEIGPERMLYSDRLTYGHRRMGPAEVSVASVSEYRDKMQEAFVIVDRDRRVAILKERVQELCEPLGVVPEDDEDLFLEITDLLEWPEPIVCEIPEETLILPEAITITPMKVYQRYIPLRTTDGALSKHFIAVANGEHTQEGQDLIRAGNERVLHARLRDAAYFWETDTKTRLAEFAEGLGRVTFHQDLGSVGDKIARLKALHGKLKGALPAVDDAAMDQVLTLMKADLTTQMVGEFDSLEGVVGMLYAKEQGIADDIADALFEHRLPRRADDKLPENTLGIVAGMLDRLDTLAGYFGLGMRVKGTSDPFGLRRNTLAVLAIIDAADLDLDIEHCLRAALDNYGDLVKDADAALQAFLTFAEDRLAVMTRDKGYAHDLVAAALPGHATRPLHFRRCVDALRKLDGEALQDLAEQAKRIKRILDAPADAVNEALLIDEERALYQLCQESRPVALEKAANGAFDEAISEFLGWLPVIAKYFEDVLVNDKDEAVKKNRHALLNSVLAGMTEVADVTAIEKKDTA